MIELKVPGERRPYDVDQILKNKNLSFETEYATKFHAVYVGSLMKHIIGFLYIFPEKIIFHPHFGNNKVVFSLNDVLSIKKTKYREVFLFNGVRFFFNDRTLGSKLFTIASGKRRFYALVQSLLRPKANEDGNYEKKL